MRRWLVVVGISCLFGFLVAGCSREQANLSRAGQIKSGMTFHKVYRILGKPDVGWGLPQKGSKEGSDLYYRIPGDKYLIVHFVGYYVGDPPTSIEDRSVLVF